MKKLMFAAVAAAMAGAVFAAEGEVNSQIVGFQTKTTREGFNFYAPVFKNCGDKELDIQSIQLKGDNQTSLADNIQILDKGGASTHVFFWVAAGESGFEDKGIWLDDDMMGPVDYKIKPGESVLVSSQNDAVDVIFVGEVNEGDLEFTSIEGFNFFGNPSPNALDIQDIQLAGDNQTSLADNIQILDKGGASEHVFFWVAAGESGLEDKGIWLDDDMMGPVDYEVQGGEGLLISTQQAGVTIKIPGLKLN